MSDKKVTIAIIGAGSRGMGAYGSYCMAYSDKVKVIAVAEPRAEKLKTAGIAFNRSSRSKLLPPQHFPCLLGFSSWW